MKKILIMLGFFLSLSLIMTAVQSQSAFPTTFQNSGFESVQRVADIGVCETVFRVFANTCDAINRTDNKQAYVNKIHRPTGWTTSRFDAVETSGTSNTGSRSVLIFTALNTSYGLDGLPNPNNEQCSYQGNISPASPYRCSNTDPAGKTGAVDLTIANRTVNGSIEQTIRITSPATVVSWFARALDFRPVKSTFVTVPETFYGDNTGLSSIYNFKVINHATGSVILDLGCGRKVNDTTRVFCDAGDGEFVKNTIDLSGLGLSAGQNITFKWETAYPEVITDGSLSQPNGVYIDDVSLTTASIITIESSPMDLFINNVTTPLSILTSNNTVTTSGASGQLSARTLSRSEISRGFGDFYLFNITINDTRTAGNFIGPTVINIIRFLDSNDNAINVTNENLRINPSLVTAQTVSWNMYGYLPKQVEKIEVNLSYDTSATAVGRVTINQTFAFNPSIKSSRNIFANTIQNSAGEIITGLYPIAFYNFDFDELTRNTTFSVVNFRRVLGVSGFSETENNNFFIFDNSSNLLDGTVVINKIYSSFITNDFTDFLATSVFGSVGNNLVVNRTSTFPFSNAYSPLLTNSNRTITTTSFVIADVLGFCSSRCIGSDLHVRAFIGDNICSETVTFNATECFVAPVVAEPTPIVPNATQPLSFVNATQIQEAGLGFILPFITPLFISIFILLGIGGFIETKIKSHGIGFIAIMVMGLGLLTLFGVMPLGFGIVLILSVSLILVWQLSKVFLSQSP